MLLNINDDREFEEPSESDLRKSISSLGEDEFAILTLDEEVYVQTYLHEDGTFELEFRDGSSDRHYELATEEITREEVEETFVCFLKHKNELLTRFTWEKLDLEDEDFEDDFDDEFGDGEEEDEEQVEYNGVMMSASWPSQIEAAQETTTLTINGITYDRISFGHEENVPTTNLPYCGDCGIVPGQLHVPGCDTEECPSCKGQLLSCDCDVEGDEEDDEEV